MFEKSEPFVGFMRQTCARQSGGEGGKTAYLRRLPQDSALCKYHRYAGKLEPNARSAARRIAAACRLQ